MDGLYFKMTDIYDMFQRLVDKGVIDDYQKSMLEIECDSMDFIGLPRDSVTDDDNKEPIPTMVYPQVDGITPTVIMPSETKAQ